MSKSIQNLIADHLQILNELILINKQLFVCFNSSPSPKMTAGKMAKKRELSDLSSRLQAKINTMARNYEAPSPEDRLLVNNLVYSWKRKVAEKKLIIEQIHQYSELQKNALSL